MAESGSDDEVVDWGVDCEEGVDDLSGVKAGLIASGVEYINDGGPEVDGVVGCGE